MFPQNIYLEQTFCFAFKDTEKYVNNLNDISHASIVLANTCDNFLILSSPINRQ